MPQASVVESDLRVVFAQAQEREAFVRDFVVLQRGQSVYRVGIFIVRDPEDAGVLKQFGAAGFGEDFLPEGQGAQRPAGVDVVGAIAHADDARFAAGAGAGVGGAVGVEAAATWAPDFAQEVGGPRAEDAGADYGDVVGV